MVSSIVLLIASHIFLKKKEDKKDGENEKEINKYLEQAATLQRNSEKESFRKLKKSIIPLVSVGMLAGGIANIPKGNTPGQLGARPERRKIQITRDGSEISQDGNDHEDQITPLLSDLPFLGKRPFIYDGNIELSTQLQLAPMPTIFESTEDDSTRSQEDAEQDRDNFVSNEKPSKQPNDITQNIDKGSLPLVHSPKVSQYIPTIVKVLESKRQVQGSVSCDLQSKTTPSGGRQRDRCNVKQCAEDLLEGDDEKLLQVTVL